MREMILHAAQLVSTCMALYNHSLDQGSTQQVALI